LPVDYDPGQYVGSAAHYLIGRLPYSAKLGDVLARELGLDGAGHLLDVGCGPGVLAVQLAPLFERVTAIDPDPGMIIEARRHARSSGVAVDLRGVRAEDIRMLELPQMRAVTFGQSFHRVSRAPVAEAVYDLLEPGGAIVLISHDIDAGPVPTGTADPPIPDQQVQELITRYLGPDRRSGSRLAVISGYLSMSYAAPHLFGRRLDEFVDELRRLLTAHARTGRFWDWPGDTAALIPRKPRRS
jgi:SAM-dependent methyltransferase